MRITNNSIRKYLGLPTVSREFTIYQVDSLGVQENTLMFISKKGIDLEALDQSEECIFLLDDSYEEYYSDSNDFIRIHNPKYVFCKIVSEFSMVSRLQLNFIHNKSAIRYNNLYCEECIIGKNCHFDEGVIIGGTDFSPVLGDDRSHLVQFPQMGGVIIRDNVVIKYNSMIGKGTFGYTEIDSNTMIDFGCQIGHNCRVGKSCIIAAGTIIGGSTIIGDNCTIGIGAKIRNGLKIGNNVSIGMGSVVIKEIPDNCVVVGNPAHIINHDQIFNERGLV